MSSSPAILPRPRTQAVRGLGRARRIGPLALLFTLLLGAAPAAAATLTVRFTNQGQPLEDPQHGKFYVYEVGEREQYLAWGHAARSVRVPDGVYDVLVRYSNDRIERERLWEAIELTGSVQRSIDFDLPVARITVTISSGGVPIPQHAGSFAVHRAGQRGEPMAARRPGTTLVISPGIYDIEVAYRGPQGLERRWLEGYAIRGEHLENVEFGTTQASVTLTLTHRGRALAAGEARWRLYRPGVRGSSIAEARSGETRSVDAGVYDIGVFYRGAGGRGERWLTDVELIGAFERSVELAPAEGRVRLAIEHRRRPVHDAWCAIFPAGRRDAALQSGRSGEDLELPPGTYDVGCFLQRGGLRVEQWIEAATIRGGEDLMIELQFVEASLRVRPARGSRGGADDGAASVLVVLDSSAAMAGSVGGRSWLEQVGQELPAALDLFGGTPVRVGLRAFGIAPRAQQDCRDSTLLVRPGRFDRRALGRAVELLRPAGMAPIAYSLERLADDLPDRGDSAVLLIAAGTEECGGDPCAAAARLLRDEAVGRIEVIALGADGRRRHPLECAGRFHAVRSQPELGSTLLDVLRDIRRSGGESVAIFTPGWGELLVAGGLGERLVVASGRYDVLVHAGGETFRWPDLEIRGRMTGRAGDEPPR